MPIEQTEVSILPTSQQQIAHSNLLPTILFIRTIPAGYSKIPPQSLHPKATKLCLKTEWQAGKWMYSTTRQCLQQSLLWPTQPADPLNTISPCLLGKRQFKLHSHFTCYIHGTKTTAKQHNEASCTPENPYFSTIYSAFMRTHQPRPTPTSLRFC